MKRLKFIAFASAISLVLALQANAHSGRTDSSGGHTDQSTGDYHYHHGYPAHDHYDMDGDGDIDCPYDFDDRTNTNSGSDFDSSTESTAHPVKNQTSLEEGEPNMPQWVYWTIGGLSLALILACRSLNRKDDRLAQAEAQYHELKNTPHPYTKWIGPLFKAEVRRRHAAALEEVRAQRTKTIAELGPDVRINFRDPFPYSLFEDFDNSAHPYILPRGVGIEKDGLPSLGYTSPSSPYGKYTVYISSGGECYHENSRCRQNLMKPVNLMTVICTRRPCSACAHYTKNAPKSYPNWYRNFANTSRELAIDWNDDEQEE